MGAIMSLPTTKSEIETMLLICPGLNMIDIKSGNSLLGTMQDSGVSLYLLTSRKLFFNIHFLHNLINHFRKNIKQFSALYGYKDRIMQSTELSAHTIARIRRLIFFKVQKKIIERLDDLKNAVHKDVYTSMKVNGPAISPSYVPNSPVYNPAISPSYVPNSPVYNPISSNKVATLANESPVYNPSSPQDGDIAMDIDTNDNDNDNKYNNVSMEEDETENNFKVWDIIINEWWNKNVFTVKSNLDLSEEDKIKYEILSDIGLTSKEVVECSLPPSIDYTRYFDDDITKGIRIRIQNGKISDDGYFTKADTAEDINSLLKKVNVMYGNARETTLLNDLNILAVTLLSHMGLTISQHDVLLSCNTQAKLWTIQTNRIKAETEEINKLLQQHQDEIKIWSRMLKYNNTEKRKSNTYDPDKKQIGNNSNEQLFSVILNQNKLKRKLNAELPEEKAIKKIALDKNGKNIKESQIKLANAILIEDEPVRELIIPIRTDLQDANIAINCSNYMEMKKRHKTELEMLIMQLVEERSSQYEKILKQEFEKRKRKYHTIQDDDEPCPIGSNLLSQTESGSKANNSKIMKMMHQVGHQSTDGKLPKRMFGERDHIYYSKLDYSLESFGYINGRYLYGFVKQTSIKLIFCFFYYFF